MAAALCLTFGGAALGLLVGAGRRLRGSTLVGPWLWVVVAIVLLTAAEVVIAVLPGQSGNAPLLRYAAAVATCCPAVALLGASRPQHAAWQFVVATLYVVLLVPTAQTRGFPGGVVSVDSPWSWFLLALVLVGLLNGLPTRFWPAVVVGAAAQLVLLSPYLPGGAWDDAFSGWQRTATGLGLAVVALAAAQWRAATVRRTSAMPLDRIWLDFRDAYGALWGLRIQQRVNAAATMYGWPVILSWDGFRERSDGTKVAHLPPDVSRAAVHMLRGLLWRFVAPRWIDERL